MSETRAAKLEEVRIEAPGFEEELAQRHRLLREDLEELGAEVLIATREASVTYLTGYTTRTWSNFSRPIVALLFADGSLEMLCADTEAQQIEARVPNVVARGYGGLRPVEPGAPLPDGRFQFSPGAVEALDQLLRERGVSRIAVDGLGALHPPVSQLTAGLGEWPRRLIDASTALWERRLIKSDWEVDQLIRAARVLEAAFDLLPDRLAPGLSERELHGLLGAACFEAGADEIGYTDVVVVGGGREIFGSPTDRVWNPGEVLYVDGGVIVNGYWADFCRQYTVGAPTAAQADAFAVVAEERERALSEFRVGMAAGELGALMGEAAGIDPGSHQAGRFGHGIGLYMPEPPSLAPVDTTPLEPGIAFCLEPMLFRDGTHYVIEEEYVVGTEGLKPITEPAPQELIGIS